MTQFEAEGLLHILKRRKAEEVSLIEQMYEVERQRLESDRLQTMNRIAGHINQYQIELVHAKDESFKARGKEDWKEKALKVKEVCAMLTSSQRELAEVNRFYQSEFKLNRDKRDESLRRLNTKISEERSRILIQVEYPKKEEQTNYWKQKYYQLKAEVDKMKKTA